MSQSCDPDQVGKVLRLCIKEHLHGKIRTKLRYAQCSQRTAADIVRSDPQRLSALKQAHNLRTVQRDILNRVKTSQILEHSYHGGIIVSQNIQL